MGAPLINWAFRAAVAAATAAGTWGIVRLPIPIALRLALMAVGAALAAAVAFRFLPAFDPRGRIRWRLPRDPRGPVCALTFDDGPSPATLDVLDILAREGVKATFFVLGVNVARHPDTVRRMAAEGHAIGLHGMDHRKLAAASEQDVESQLEAATAALREAGVSPAPIYRVPHGMKSPAVFAAARRRGLALWAWSRGVWDTAGPAPETLVSRATRLARPGLVLLLHDGRGEERQPDISPMLAALPAIIGRLKARGFRFVALPPGPNR